VKLVMWTFAVCLLTASFDLFLVVDIGGTLRIAQVLMLFVMLAALARILQDGRILWPRGASALSLWVIMQFGFLAFCGNLSLGIQFFVLMLSMALSVMAVVQIWGDDPSIAWIMRAYMISYIVVAAYGVLQFFSPLLFHVTMPLTMQWYVHGRVPRVNGFNYEPSYYATYMIIGWIMMVDLRMTGAKIASSRRMRNATIVVSVAMFVCASKTGWIVMLIELLSRVMPKIIASLRRSVRGVRYGRLALEIPSSRTLAWATALVGGFTVVILAAVLLLPDWTILIAGTGLAGTPAHSYNDRSNRLIDTWEAFKTSPFVGRSLGGVPVQIGLMKGIEVTDMATVRVWWGYPVLLDVLAASGLTGFIPFLLFLWSTTFGALRVARVHIDDERGKWLHALSRAMIFEWLVLMGDPNLLRIYLWFHMAMVMTVRYNLEYAPASAYVRAARQRLLPSRAAVTA